MMRHESKACLKSGDILYKLEVCSYYISIYYSILLQQLKSIPGPIKSFKIVIAYWRSFRALSFFPYKISISKESSLSSVLGTLSSFEPHYGTMNEKRRSFLRIGRINRMPNTPSTGNMRNLKRSVALKVWVLLYWCECYPRDDLIILWKEIP